MCIMTNNHVVASALLAAVSYAEFFDLSTPPVAIKVSFQPRRLFFTVQDSLT
jgi:hypothetical protein